MTDWQLTVESRARRVRAELDELADTRVEQHEYGAAIAALADVDKALAGVKHWWQAIAAWWSGWYIEQAWRALHEAEVWATAAHPDLVGRLPGLRQRIADCLPAGDLRRQALDTLQPGPVASLADKAVITAALRAAFDASDDAHAAARALRNKLIVASAALFIINTVLGVVGLLKPDFLPMCVRIPQIVDGIDKGGYPLCATGSHIPTAPDVWLVQLLGAFGGIISVVVLLTRRRPSLSPYVLTGYQALIKVFFGSALAVLGILGLDAGIAQGLASITTQAGLLLAAALLGYAQQVGTRLLDNYADRVMDQVRPLPVAVMLPMR